MSGGPYTKQVVPGDDIIPVTEASTDLPDGTCRALWIGTAGNITIVTPSGEVRGPIPVLQGLFPMKCVQVRVTVTDPASNVFAIY